jgi:hypothetical protein
MRSYSIKSYLSCLNGEWNSQFVSCVFSRVILNKNRTSLFPYAKISQCLMIMFSYRKFDIFQATPNIWKTIWQQWGSMLLLKYMKALNFVDRSSTKTYNHNGLSFISDFIDAPSSSLGLYLDLHHPSFHCGFSLWVFSL